MMDFVAAAGRGHRQTANEVIFLNANCKHIVVPFLLPVPVSRLSVEICYPCVPLHGHKVILYGSSKMIHSVPILSTFQCNLGRRQNLHRG